MIPNAATRANNVKSPVALSDDSGWRTPTVVVSRGIVDVVGEVDVGRSTPLVDGRATLGTLTTDGDLPDPVGRILMDEFTVVSGIVVGVGVGVG